jgi:hypothetical protein
MRDGRRAAEVPQGCRESVEVVRRLRECLPFPVADGGRPLYAERQYAVTVALLPLAGTLRLASDSQFDLDASSQATSPRM